MRIIRDMIIRSDEVAESLLYCEQTLAFGKRIHYIVNVCQAGRLLSINHAADDALFDSPTLETCSMTPKEIALLAIESAEQHSRFPEMFKDELSKEIAKAISRERQLISRYLTHLNESIAQQPHLVRHKLGRADHQLMPH